MTGVQTCALPICFPVTISGRTFSFAAIVVVGNGDGIIGWGLGKVKEIADAARKGGLNF